MERLTLVVPNGDIWLLDATGTPCTLVTETEDDDTYKYIKKLAEYEDLEEQGKLLKLPCAIGDTVYRVNKGMCSSPDRVYECKVVGVMQEYNNLCIKIRANIIEETYSIWVNDWFGKCQIGHEFFLTQEEAEAALENSKERDLINGGREDD